MSQKNQNSIMLISESQQNEYRKKYNPDGSKLRDYQLGMLDILKYIDSICKEHNISYWLSSGTCLGAVRHGGFIPWDDDVDIEMLKPDYDKLIKILSNQHKNILDFCLQNNSNDPLFIYDFSKVRNQNVPFDEWLPLAKYYKHKGLFIDIVKLEESNSKTLHYICGRLRVLEYHILNFTIKKCHFFIKPALFLHKLNNVFFAMIRPLDRIGAKGQLRHTLGVTFTKHRNINDIFPLRRMAFEDIELPVPNDYHNYLTKIYGDYTKIIIGMSHLSVSNNYKKN